MNIKLIGLLMCVFLLTGCNKYQCRIGNQYITGYPVAKQGQYLIFKGGLYSSECKLIK